MNYLYEMAKALKLPGGVQPADEYVIDEHLRITFESDQFDRFYELIVTVQKGESQLIGVIEFPNGSLDLMQFLCLSPVLAPPEFAPPTERMIQLINKISPIPGFCLDETDNRILFRYALPLTPETCHHDLILNTLNAIQQIIDLYLPALEEVALGNLNLNAFLSESSQEFFHNYESMAEFFKNL